MAQNSPHRVDSGQGEAFELGIARMRLLAGSAQSGGAFAMAEFTGDEGAWTVPHIHRETAESFFVLDGRFTFTIAGGTSEAGPGDYMLVPAGLPNVLGALAGGGRALVGWTPAGLERRSIELSRLSPDALLDPKTRAEVASRHDSHPV